MPAPAETPATADPQSQETYSPALPIGHILNEYQIESVLGIGSYGITYLAHDSNLQHKVAIKEYYPANLAARNPATGTVGIKSPDCQTEFTWGKTRYTQEAQTLARFNHPNIVRVNRYFEANHTSYLVMDYEEGKSLEATLSEGQTWTQRQLLDLLLPLLAGLETIHQKNYLHRDIKPDNIILRNKDNSPVLIDFGAARSTASNANMTAMVSPGYGPAEQYSSDTADQGPWTDLYALAAVAYRIVSGRIPVPAPNRIKKDSLIPAVFVGQDRYSKALLKAIDQALSIDETKRPQNIATWSKQLLEADAAAPSEPEPQPTPIRIADPTPTPEPETQPASPPERRHPKEMPKREPDTHWEKHGPRYLKIGKWLTWATLALLASLIASLNTDKGYLQAAHLMYTSALKANNPDLIYSFLCPSYFQSEMNRSDLEKDAGNAILAQHIEIIDPITATITSTKNDTPATQTWIKPTANSLWCRDVVADYNNNKPPAIPTRKKR